MSIREQIEKAEMMNAMFNVIGEYLGDAVKTTGSDIVDQIEMMGDANGWELTSRGVEYKHKLQAEIAD